MDKKQKLEWLKCAASVAYFIYNYCFIYDATAKTWIPFKLWPEQYQTLKLFETRQLIIALKARQLGLTWLALCYILWLMVFHPIATALLFSRRDDEAMYLLSKERLRGIYSRLPDWMKARDIDKDSGHQWSLSTGSIAQAFPTNAGDSYTASVVLVDEADLILDLDSLMTAVKPTIDGGGQMLLISRSNKDLPASAFKNMYRAAKSGENNWAHIFLPWNVRPERDEDWYEEQKRDVFTRTQALDDLYEQYPATDEEALAARELDKRISPRWIAQCYQELACVTVNGQNYEDVPAIPGLRIYKAPEPGRRYVAGGDPAEGNPNSHDSSWTFLDAETGEEVANLSGKFEIDVFANHGAEIAKYYNNASLLVERNNHGHAVLLWLKDNAQTIKLFSGDDRRTKRKKPGWHSTTLGKSRLYTIGATTFKDAATLIHDYDTMVQITSIEGSSLKAPPGKPDDRSDSYMLGLAARTLDYSGGWVGGLS